MGLRERLAYRLLERLLNAAEKGQHAHISAWLHELLAAGSGQFRQALDDLV